MSGLSYRPCNQAGFEVMDGKENASTTTLNKQRFNIKDSIVNGRENVENGM